MSNEIQYWKVTEVAKRFRVAPITIYKLIDSGELRAFRVGKGPYRISEDDLTKFERWNRV